MTLTIKVEITERDMLRLSRLLLSATILILLM
jgi:hypothetical protein